MKCQLNSYLPNVLTAEIKTKVHEIVNFSRITRGSCEAHICFMDAIKLMKKSQNYFNDKNRNIM